MYEFQGTVKMVGELQKFSSGFEKQDLVVEEDKDGNRSNVVAFTFKKNAISKLAGVTPGAHVKVGFVVDGREWADPKTGKVRYFFRTWLLCDWRLMVIKNLYLNLRICQEGILLRVITRNPHSKEFAWEVAILSRRAGARSTTMGRMARRSTLGAHCFSS
ncbi:MAG: DUF3127 domain-containing protein [Prevotella sp.]|nr:DUF3127 domain-containing protein [Prevotella sp.]